MELYLNFDYVLKDEELARFKGYILKRLEHTPIQYILGEAHFRNLRLRVNESVLIPRPETELLVDRVLSSLLDYINEFRKLNLEINCINLLEIGTGSGAIAISLVKEIDGFLDKNTEKILNLPANDNVTETRQKNGITNDINWHVIATEKSSSSLEVAGKNAKNLLDPEELHKIEFVNADIVPPVSEKNFSSRYRSLINIIVSNPPYISIENYKKLVKEVKDFEPREALYAGEGGLEIYEKILKSIIPYVNKTLCILLFETDPQISSSLKDLILKSFSDNAMKIRDINIEKDYNQQDRIIIAEIAGTD